jgi:hypothetical protein
VTLPSLKPHRHRPSQERRAIKAPIPRAWPDSTIVLIGGGPSLTRPQVESARQAWIAGRIRVLGCNEAYQAAPWIDGLYADSRPWWEQHIEAVRDVHLAMLFSADEKACDMYGLWYVASRPELGLSGQGGCIHTGRAGSHAGLHLLNLAVLLGAARILLLGYDCRVAAAPPPRSCYGNAAAAPAVAEQFDCWVDAYRHAADDAAELGVAVLNCSPDSAIDAFPRTRIGAVLGT